MTEGLIKRTTVGVLDSQGLIAKNCPSTSGFHAGLSLKLLRADTRHELQRIWAKPSCPCMIQSHLLQERVPAAHTTFYFVLRWVEQIETVIHVAVQE